MRPVRLLSIAVALFAGVAGASPSFPATSPLPPLTLASTGARTLASSWAHPVRRPGGLKKTTAAEQLRVMDTIEQAPVAFERNTGQYGNGPDFVWRGSGYSYFVQATGVSMLRRGAESGSASQIGMTLVGSRADARVVTSEPARVVTNYYVGHDRTQWHTGVPSFGRVRYAGVYGGVDVEYYGRGGNLEYDFVVAPGMDPSKINMAFDGMQAICVDSDGSLVVETPAGAIRHARPYAYQHLADGTQRVVDSRFALHDGKVSFELGQFDRSAELVIDPAIVGTYHINTFNYIDAMATDAAGNVYVAGWETYSVAATRSELAPGSRDPYQNFWILKLTAGGAVDFCTYLGGSGWDEATDIAVDPAGNVYIAATTSSPDFPTTAGVIQPIIALGTSGYPSNAVGVVKLTNTGALSYSTLISAEEQSSPTAIAVDSSGYAYVAGTSWAKGLPGTIDTRPQMSHYNWDISFVAKLNPTATALAWMSIINGQGGSTDIKDLTLDSQGVYVTGETTASGMPTTPGAYQRACSINCDDAFAAKLNPADGTITYMTYIGASDSDLGKAIAVDAAHNVYIGGDTRSLDFPTTPDALQKTPPNNTYNGFYLKLDPTLSTLQYSTYLGGAYQGIVLDVVSDGSNVNVLADGTANFPLLNSFPYATSCTPGAAGAVFVLQFNTSSQLQYSVCFPTYSGKRFAAGGGTVFVPLRSDYAFLVRKLSSGVSPLLTLRDFQPAGTSDVPGRSFRVYADAGTFTSGSVVTFGGTPATSSYLTNDTVIDGVAPVLGPGLYDVTVTTPGGAVASLQGAYEVVPGTFSISGISPTSVLAYENKILTVSGAGFVPQSSVALTRVGTGVTVNAQSYRLNANTMIAVVPTLAAGIYDVSVLTPVIYVGSPVAVTLASALTITGPRIDAGLRSGGSTAGGDQFIVNGDDVTTGTTVTIGGLPAPSGGTPTSFTTPAHPAGRVDVVVNTPGAGTATFAGAFLYFQAMNITDVQPLTGSPAGGTAVTITGTGFQPGARVFFDDNQAFNVVVGSSTSITLTTPPHSSAPARVVVINADGGTDYFYNDFRYAGPWPQSVAFNSTGSVGGGTPVNISGDSFDATCHVFFDNIEATVTGVSSLSISVTAPPHAAGLVDIRVTNGLGQSGTLIRKFTYLDAAPTVSGISPAFGPASGGTPVTISGTNFVAGTRVTIGGQLLQNPIISSTSITGTTPPGSPGQQQPSVRIVTPDGQVVTTTYTYTAAPTITTLSPATGPVAGGTAVTINGTNFASPVSVSFGGTPATGVTFVSATQVQATSPAHAAADVDVVVTNFDAQFATTTNGFRYLPGLPTITALNPTIGLVGDSVVVTGTNFVFVSAVKFSNNVNAPSYVVNSPTQITVTVPGGAVNGPISVTNVTGTATSSSSFTVDTTGPRVDTFTPTSGGPGTSVIITGARFTGATAVKFGGINAGTFTVNSATQITATVSATALTGPISVISPAGTGISGPTFGVSPRFSATPFTPSSAAPGATVTISGANFQGATAVSFNGTAATSFTPAGDGSSISVTVPAGATSGPVSVTTPYGTVISPTSFNVPPIITTFTPLSGGPGASVTITGARFTGATAVAFGGYASSFTVNNDTTITATVGVNGGTGSVTVTTPNGTATSSSTFTFTGPTISGFTPTTGTAGTSVVITGSNLSGATAVTFNGVPAAITANTATSVTANAPAGVTNGPIAVTVGGATVTSTGLFYSVPYISTFTPSTGAPGSVVTISGGNFLGATAVGFGTPPAPSLAFNVISNTQIQAQVPGFATTGPITVTTPYSATATTSAGTFTVTAAPSPVLSVRRIGGSAAIALTWTGALQQYDIQRATSAAGPFATNVIATVQANAAIDNSTASGVTYFYRISRNGTAQVSNVDFGIAYAFTDDPVAAGLTPVKAQHLTELRAAVNMMRVAAGLGAASWTDPSPSGVAIRAIHVNELRTAVTQAWIALGVSQVNFTDPGTIAGGTAIKAVHFQELRNAVK